MSLTAAEILAQPDAIGFLAIVYTLLEILGIAAAVHAVFNARSAQGSTAWAIALVAAPLIALPFYLFFGRNRFSGYVDARRDSDSAHRYWAEMPRETFVALEGETILGTYYINPNHPGPGSHVCNCGYVTCATARGKGVATSMCEHSQQTAIEMGFRSMQFNLVVSTNTGAVRLWQKLGYEISGTLPEAYHHATEGYVDAYVMSKILT